MSKDRTPLMRQYHQIKAKYPDTILLFRLGDFYETFEDDAVITARVAGITLTKRGNGSDPDTPLAGFPYHQLDNYLPKLVKAGYRVAVCEQLEDPKLARGIVRRDVIEVVTPGVAMSDKLLEAGRNNYLAAVYIEREEAGVAFCDISTGEFSATETPLSELNDVLESISPAEIIVSRAQKDRFADNRLSSQPRITRLEEWTFDHDYAVERLREHFGTVTVKGFGLDDLRIGTIAAGAVMHYLMETQRARLSHIRKITRYAHGDYIALDPATKRNLEIVTSSVDGGRHGSLINVLDRTCTPMGGRLLKKWIIHPLKSREQIEKRLAAVENLHREPSTLAELEKELRMMSDLERMVARVATGRASPRDLGSIRGTLERIPRLSELLLRCASPTLTALARSFVFAEELVDKLHLALPEEPPGSLGDGGVVRMGYSPELDELRDLRASGKSYIESLQERERARSGISSLKVGFNSVFGYYIEITNANRDRVPADYHRKQTLANAERYITPELKEYEEKVLHAEEKIATLEREIFTELQSFTAERSDLILRNAQLVAMLDCFSSFARIARERDYTRPTIEDSSRLEIIGGRHPVVETLLPPGERYVPNDTTVDTEEQQIAIITGPNMSGKCLLGEVLIFSDHGLVKIRDLEPSDSRVGEFSKLNRIVQGKDGRQHATHFFSGGRQSTVKLTTRLGYQIECTPEHKLWVRHADGCEYWMMAGDVTEGTVLSLQRDIDLWGEFRKIPPFDASLNWGGKKYLLPTELDEDLAYLMGLLVGDGCLTRKHAIGFTSGDAFIADEFIRIVAHRFGYKPQVRSKGQFSEFKITSKQIKALFDSLGLGSEKAPGKHVPHSIMRAPRNIVVAFLQGLFDTDGYASKKYGNVQYATASERLATEVQLLLLNFGIIASKQVKKTPRLPSHLISIYGAEAIRFHERVGFRLARKSERAASASGKRMPNVGGIPHMEKILKKVQADIVATQPKPVALKHNKSINSIFYTYIPTGRNISYTKLDELVEYCHQSNVECDELESIQEHRYFYDPVVKIETGEADVYDLSVETDHAYIANGFVSHNSSYLRQNGLIVLMAQIGSFVPAEQATIGIVDRIFTRVGAQDNMAAGESTFLVEMHEAANILNNATSQSLILLDEVGRGTSTFDGISIAWAMTEYLHERIGARTLFATHYHELNALAERFGRIRNYKVEVREHDDQVIFLRRVTPGTADHSYGIQVAQMAGLPEEVTARAKEILAQLETASEGNPIGGTEEGLLRASATSGSAAGPTVRRASSQAVSAPAPQISLFEVAPSDPWLQELKVRLESIDLQNLTPIQALMELERIQKLIREKSARGPVDRLH